MLLQVLTLSASSSQVAVSRPQASLVQSSDGILLYPVTRCPWQPWAATYPVAGGGRRAVWVARCDFASTQGMGTYPSAQIRRTTTTQAVALHLLTGDSSAGRPTRACRQ